MIMRVKKGMKRLQIKTNLIVLLAMLIAGCNGRQDSKELDKFFDEHLIECNRDLTRVVITDVLTPPVCSRVYAYTNIAAHEALAAGKHSYSGKLNGLNKVPEPEGKREDYYLPLSSIVAFCTVAQKVVFNSDAIQTMEDEFLASLDRFDIDPKVFERSVNYGRTVGNFILEWASHDGYLERNSFPAYTVTKENWRWQPTPPDYSDAVEPNWHTLRPFTLDSTSQFRPVPPDLLDTASGSSYHKSAMEVYEAVNRKDKEQVEIAKFWDCNPNISVTQGHVTYFQQKISPAGHWLNIASSVLQAKKAPMAESAKVLSTLAIAIADGFINCWEAKFHYNTIRPETIINRYIDKDWRPLLQTPPFPEYPSGHSVVSGASSLVLTKMLGDNYAYTDSTELPFGIPPRSYKSFYDAAREASISRLYGGIHYLPALNNGLEEGMKIGEHVLARLR
jgi:hypothetical protein